MQNTDSLYGTTAFPPLMKIVASLSLVGFVSSAVALDYGDFSGFSVSYLGVEETSVTDTPPLYGAPSVVGNTLDFDPKGFGAASSGGGAPDLTDGQLNFGVQANPGYAIASLRFSESGDYSLVGLGTADTYTSVAAAFFIDIVEVDGVAIDPVQITANMTFEPNTDGSFELPTDPGIAVIWKGNLVIDLNSELDDQGIAYDLGATLVNVSLDNTLVAQSEATTTSFIAKKDFKVVTVVPEPTSIALALLGGLLLIPALRRR